MYILCIHTSLFLLLTFIILFNFYYYYYHYFLLLLLLCPFAAVTHTSPNLLDLYRNFDSATKCITILIRINSYTKITEISSHCQPFPCHTNSVELSVDLWGKNMQTVLFMWRFCFCCYLFPTWCQGNKEIVIIWKKHSNVWSHLSHLYIFQSKSEHIKLMQEPLIKPLFS